jgi:hypothetical protein
MVERRRASSRKALEKARARAARVRSLVDDNIVEISLAVGERGHEAFSAHVDGLQSASYLVRENIKQTAQALARLEADDPKLWESHDWFESCAALAKAICKGRRGVDVRAVLR